ncbi:hypothetical protein CYD94_09520 [Ralstonia solanacearum]|uniref:Uncharacterized protein n=1 Tax=Ralstonia pseudosolanacearum TaxID=1310165 RepID=A0A454TLV3_9RALS|nr:hypothetical protein CYD94_09520 [Ralstonia solanacearum]RAA08389.1 hypothetical protein DOT67_19185 [Ralstonia pseudosolanacearum]RAA10273.1 hypothetical protein DOT79_21445 [Ralstonia pseudosolanacearum]RNM03097.1 hypothetical protein EGA29_19710 [Ralstonia pseudosolanacearum]
MVTTPVMARIGQCGIGFVILQLWLIQHTASATISQRAAGGTAGGRYTPADGQAEPDHAAQAMALALRERGSRFPDTAALAQRYARATQRCARLTQGRSAIRSLSCLAGSGRLSAVPRLPARRLR